MSIFDYSKTYVPVYPQFVQITKLHERVHWVEDEIKLNTDVEQWKRGDVTDADKAFIKGILRLFTQSDVAVGTDYYDNLIPVIKNNEARNMLGSFAAREGIHQRAYALLNDTLGFGEDFYIEFLNFKSMKDKMDLMLYEHDGTPSGIAKGVALQVLLEGVCLFSSFAMLLNYQRQGLMMGMGDVNQFGLREESLHVLGLSEIFKTIVAENPDIVTDSFKKDIYESARSIVTLEDAFIDEVFEQGSPKGITSEEVKTYIRSVCDYRMQQLGFKPEYNVTNPFEWLEWVTSSSMMENFFENNTAGYSKSSMVGSYSEGY